MQSLVRNYTQHDSHPCFIGALKTAGHYWFLGWSIFDSRVVLRSSDCTLQTTFSAFWMCSSTVVQAGFFFVFCFPVFPSPRYSIFSPVQFLHTYLLSFNQLHLHVLNEIKHIVSQTSFLWCMLTFATDCICFTSTVLSLVQHHSVAMKPKHTSITFQHHIVSLWKCTLSKLKFIEAEPSCP